MGFAVFDYVLDGLKVLKTTVLYICKSPKRYFFKPDLTRVEKQDVNR